MRGWQQRVEFGGRRVSKAGCRVILRPISIDTALPLLLLPFQHPPPGFRPGPKTKAAPPVAPFKGAKRPRSGECRSK